MDLEAWRRRQPPCSSAESRSPSSISAPETNRIVPPGLPREHALALSGNGKKTSRISHPLNGLSERRIPHVTWFLGGESLVHLYRRDPGSSKKSCSNDTLNAFKGLITLRLWQKSCDLQIFKDREDGFWEAWPRYSWMAASLVTRQNCTSIGRA